MAVSEQPGRRPPLPTPIPTRVEFLSMSIARRTLCVALVCLTACLAFSAPAHGQQIQQDAKIAEGRLTAEQLQRVPDFVGAWLDRLLAGDPENVTDARNAILREFRTPGISETFRDAFSVEVSKRMGDAVRSETDLVRINAMIIATQLTNPEALGAGIATAFVATIYGVGFANLIFLPLGGRLHALIDGRSRYQEAAIVGLMALGLGEHPAKVAMKLQSYQGG